MRTLTEYDKTIKVKLQGILTGRLNQLCEEQQITLKDLSPKAQAAFWWVVKNIKMVNELCKGKRMTEEKIEILTQKALEEEDFVAFYLILYKKVMDQQKNKK